MKEVLKVTRVDELAKVYIVEYESKIYRVHMVSEQIGKGNPGEITCIIDKSKESIVITQDIETLLRKHYKEGDEVMYRIEKVTDSYYFLKDQFGYSTYLDKKYKINPTITPNLKCRIKSITNKRASVELIEKISPETSQFTIGLEFVQNLFKQYIDTYESITQLLLADEIIGSFDSECHRWIYSICKQSEESKETLGKIKEACLAIMEESQLLKQCNLQERIVLEDRLTTLIEQLGYYIAALKYVEDGKEIEFIEKQLNTLQNTGYVFHPKKNFYIMMCAFLIKSKTEDGKNFIDTMMPKVFETIRSCDLTNWKRQPFKLVWIKLLEFFITSLKQNEDYTSNDRTSLGNIVQALALQYNLIEETDEAIVDNALNLSMLYRYCSKIGVMNPMLILDIAYLTIIEAVKEEPNIINNTSDPDRLACVIANQVSKYTPDTNVSMIYEGKLADILLDNSSIKIIPKNMNLGNASNAIPEHISLWKNLQIMQFSKPNPISKANRKMIKPYKELWVNAERELMDHQVRGIATEKKKLRIDQNVDLIITKQIASETPTFECKVVIEDEITDYVGTIRMADMVGYATNSVGLFAFEKDGSPLIIEATVQDINTDGTYVFTSKEIIDEYCDDYRYENINYSDTLKCIVTGGNTLGGFYAVSEDGFSVVVKYDKDDDPIEMPKGTVIEVSCIEKGKPGFMNSIFKGIVPESNLTLAEAFTNLMGHYASGIYEEEICTDDTDDIAPDIIDKARIKEIINIIDSVASLDNDYINAYNYLGFCKMAAHIIDDESQVSFFNNKMALIELLYEFDVNNGLSEDLIKKFQANNAGTYAKYSTLSHQFRKLEIISYMGHEEHNRELCNIACDTSNSELAQLAQLIISYNFMQRTNMISQANDIQGHIKELLKLQKKDKPKKDYGQETFTQEFKTSIVYPSDSMQPDLPRQTHKIMEEICSFLNAEGGTLYIGVDDRTHLERGIEEDLKQAIFNGSKDSYDTYVRNKINKMLVPGEIADHYIKTHFDDEAHSAVYVIEIQPCPKPISIDGIFYERRGTSSRQVSEEYKNTFISNRLLNAPIIDQSQIEDIIVESKTAVAAENNETISNSGNPLEYSTDIASITTSKIRQNMHRSENLQFDEFSKYINIFNNNTYSITPQFMSDCLSLGLYDDELEENLIVVYTTGEISKISIKELLKQEEWIDYNINNKSKIVFVSPAKSSDILSVKFHSKNNDYYRFFSIEHLSKGTFTSCISPFYTGPIDNIIECEILPLVETAPYKNLLDLDNDKPGALAKKKDGQKADKLIKDFLTK